MKHCVKVPKYRVFYGPCFPAFGLNTKRYGAPAKDVTEETTDKNFYNKFDKKDQNAATTALKEKVKNQTSENQNREKEEVDKRPKQLKETVFIVGDSTIKNIDGYLLTKSINRKFLVKVKPFTTAKTTARLQSWH